MKNMNDVVIKQADNTFVKKYKMQLFELLESSLRINLHDVKNIDDYLKERLMLMEKSILEGSAIIYFAEKNETLIGFVWAYLKNRTSKEVHITDIVVSDDYQNCHIGTNLLNTTERYCRDRNYKFITLMVSSDNLSALKLYEKNGYKEQRKLLRKVLSDDRNI